jgi:hypothetical protein
MATDAVYLKGGYKSLDPRLDRVPTGHTKHLEKYPLTTATMPSQATSIPMGVNWYSNFDAPIIKRIKGRNRFVIGAGDLGQIRGGHCTCLRNWDQKDSYGWWEYYNQGQEGRCVEFGSLRALSLNNRVRYDITSKWHYHEMQKIDYWEGGSYEGAAPVYEGTSVDAAMKILSQFGAIRAKPRGRIVTPHEAPSLVRPEEGISVYRWAQSWDDVRAVLRVPADLPGVPMLNSWGRNYPREVILLDEAGDRLLREDGEFAVITDR